MIFDRIGILGFVYRRQKRVPRVVVRRWQKAFRDQPELAEDLIRFSGLMTMLPAVLEDGEVVPEPIDPGRAAYEKGQQDLAKVLLALMNVTPFELNQLMGASDEIS